MDDKQREVIERASKDENFAMRIGEVSQKLMEHQAKYCEDSVGLLMNYLKGKRELEEEWKSITSNEEQGA